MNRGSPGPEVGNGLEHHLIRVDEDDVDRKAYERCMDRPAGTKDDPVARAQLAPAEQTAQAPEHRIRDHATLANDLTIVLATENQRSHSASHLLAGSEDLPN